MAVGNESWCAKRARAPASPNKPVGGCPLVAETAGTARAQALALLNGRAVGKSLPYPLWTAALFWKVES